MTFAVAVILFAILLIYVGIKGKSLKDALMGKSTAAQSSTLLGGS